MQYIVGDVSVQRVDRYRFESQFGGDRIDRIFAELPLEEYLPDSGIAAGFDQVAEVRRRRLFPFVFEWNLRQSVIVRQVCRPAKVSCNARSSESNCRSKRS